MNELLDVQILLQPHQLCPLGQLLHLEKKPDRHYMHQQIQIQLHHLQQHHNHNQLLIQLYFHKHQKHHLDQHK